MRSPIIVLIAVLSLSFWWTAVAQTSIVSSSLEGVVTDPSGARVPGATVRARDLQTHRERDAVTSTEGMYHLSELPAGTYEVSVAQPGFARYIHTGLILPVGATAHLDIALQSDKLTTQVVVTAQPPAIDPAETSVRSGIDTERIEELPVESRNYLNFALLAPGVATSAQQSGKQSLGSLPDSGFSFGGLRGRSNNITIDGLDNNDEYVGSSRTELSLETVQEFQVVNAGLSAETGGASGGSINVITRSGANALHGDAFIFLQNGALNARNPLEAQSAPPDVHRYRTGVALGGPIIKDKTFYYAGFEQEHNRALDDSFISPGVVNAVNSILENRRWPAIGALSDGFFPVSRAETEASGKIDHQLTAANSLMLRYAFTNNREAGDAFNNAGWTDPSARGSSFIQDYALVGALTTVFNPQSVGDFRFQFAHRDGVHRTNDQTGPGVIISGLAEFGRPYEGNGRRSETHRQFTYTFSHSAGRHLWKAGATVNHVRENAAMADGFGGLYIFGSIADFDAGRPNEFRQTFGSVATVSSVTTFGGFLTDRWTIARGITMDIGLRYDYERLPSQFRQDSNNFSPRIGIAYQLTPSWVLRGGYGIFFDRYVLASLNPALQKNGANGFEQVLQGEAAAAVFQGPGSLVMPFPEVPPSIYRVDPRLAMPYSEQAGFSVEHLLARDLTASASYLFVRGVKLARTRNINLLPPGPVFAGRADPQWTDIYQLEGSASSTYQGVSLILNRRMSDELEFSANYTLSKAFDDASDFSEQPQNPFNLAAERALSLQHQQQRLTMNALWELPIGDEENGAPAKDDWFTRIFGHIELAPIVIIGSGRPVDPLTGIDSNGSHPFPLSARPAGLGRNSLSTPLMANVDLRALKYFPVGKTARLDLVAEAFNVFNHTNVVQINPIFGPGTIALPTFLQPLTASGARVMQFSLDFEF